MKNLKKIACLALAVMMVLALAVPAMAVDDNAEEIHSSEPVTTTIIAPPDSKRTYEVYQIFTGALDGETLSNVKWGKNGTGSEGEAVQQEVLDALEALVNSSATDTEKLNVIEQYVTLRDPAYEVGANSKNKESVEVTTGYYLIKDLGVWDAEAGKYGVPETQSISLYVVEVVGPTTISPKTGTTTVNKNIVENGTPVKDNNAAIGDTVTYEIVGTIPGDIDNYESFFYLFTDTLSKGLTYNEDSLTVKVNNVDATSLFYKGYEDADGKTTIKVGVNDLKYKDITDVVGQITSTTTVVVTYSATLNANAEVGMAGNPNKVDLTYSNDPNQNKGGRPTNPKVEPEIDESHPVGKTPESEVITYTTQLTITKTDENGKVLTGAGFTLTGEKLNEVLVTKNEVFTVDEDGEYWKLANGTYTTTAPILEDKTETVDGKEVTTKNNIADYDSTTTKYTKTVEYEVTEMATGEKKATVTVMVDESGEVTFRGLMAGTYTLSETTTPNGYNTIADITFTISYSKEAGFTTDNPAITVETVNNVDTLVTTIVNVSGVELPSTGGIGTTIFYVVGGILVAGAAVLLITRKRVKD